MLRYRLLSAAIVISGALLFVWLDGNYTPKGCRGVWMLPLGLYLYLGSAIECISMCKKSQIGSITWPATLGCIGVMAAACIPVLWPMMAGEAYPDDCILGKLGWPLAAIIIAQVASFVWFFRSYEPDQGGFQKAILSGWIATYFGACFALAVAMRLAGEGASGLYLLVGMIVVTKFGDTGAYFAGRMFGRTKLCANVSPGKTVEGLVGGVLLATLAAWIYFAVCLPYFLDDVRWNQSLLGIAVLGLTLTLVGVAGDLSQSIFKREFGCKDSGRLLPGLGGLWDVTDSLLPGLSIAYLLVVGELINVPGV